MEVNFITRKGIHCIEGISNGSNLCCHIEQCFTLSRMYVCLELNPLTPKISLLILLTLCHTVLLMLVWRMWYWINF